MKNYFVLFVLILFALSTTLVAQDTTAPAVITDLTASNPTASSITLTWTASTDNVGVTGYRIYRDSAEIDTTANTTYSDTGLTAETTYSYTVSAYDAIPNESNQSSSDSATTQTFSGVVYISDHFDNQSDWDGCSDHPLPWGHYSWNAGYCNKVLISGDWDDAHGSAGKSVKIIWPNGISELGMQTIAVDGKGSAWTGYWWKHDAGYTMPEQDKWIYFPQTNGVRQMLSHIGNTICFFDGDSYSLCVNKGSAANEHPDTSLDSWYNDESWHYFVIYASPENGDIRIWRDGTELGWNGDNLDAVWSGSSFEGRMTFGYQSRVGWVDHVSYFDDIIIADNMADVEVFLGVSSIDIIQPANSTPDNFTLQQNHPNPFNTQTTINYQLPIKAHTTLKIYNTLGQEIQTLINENKSEGEHSVIWDAKDNTGKQVSPGIYFYNININGNYSETRNMLIIK